MYRNNLFVMLRVYTYSNYYRESRCFRRKFISKICTRLKIRSMRNNAVPYDIVKLKNIWNFFFTRVCVKTESETNVL